MSWYQEVADYVGLNLESFIEQFFPDSKPSPYAKGIRINPAPCCGHNDCFSFSKIMNAANCYSCGSKGTRIQILEQVMGQDAARRELEKWSGIRYIEKGYTEEERKVYVFKQRVSEITAKAVDFYHQRLLNDTNAIEKQTGTNQASGQRGHTLEGLKAYKVGLSGDYITFHKQRKDEGYSAEELKEAGKMIWVPDGNFVYPYFDVKGNLVRINTKLWFRTCQKKQVLKENGNVEWVQHSCHFQTFDLSKKAKEAHEKETGHKMAMDGYSTGDKTTSFYFPFGGLNGRKKAIMVEGENDAISVWEALQELPKAYQKEFVPIALGGKMEDDAFREPFLRQFDALYEAFDNDEAGDGYRAELNAKIPDVPVYTLKQDQDFNDIDQFLKSVIGTPERFKEMMDNTEFVDTKEFLIEREGFQHTWVLKNRKFHIKFLADGSDKSGQLEGTIVVYKSGQLADKKIGKIDSIKLDSSINYARLAFSEYLSTYYNDVTWFNDKPKRSFYDLKDILAYTKEYHQVVKQLGWYLFKADKSEFEKKVKYLQDRLSQKAVAEVLQEVNGFQNEAVNPHGNFPRIQLSQFFNVTNDDAFFYFSKIVQEGETTKLVPCLLSNKKEEIRLDLLKRKDEQCLLLINNRYELPVEVRSAVMDPVEVSLQPYWVRMWQEDKLDPQDYDPANVIREIEGFIRKCYYTTDEIFKVLSLWIYATYYYMLFRSGFPYLIFNGPKGSGKSTFDSLIYLLALNPKFALDISEASLYRTISETGGTFILDEIEDLVDKRTVNSSGYAKILKGGYADLAYVYRMNMDKGVSERFSVFGPKVISNINGIEDVIGDRCIYVKTAQAPEHELKRLADIQLYKEEKRYEVHAITSRCVISALTNFQKVSEIFHNADSRLNTGNARLTQIMRPLLTIATLVGGDYTENLMNYYDREIRTVKDEIAASTTEGMISGILKRTAEELIGLEKDFWATDKERHSYSVPIKYSSSTGVFEIDTIHLKVLCEEINNGDPIDIKTINSSMKLVLGNKFNFTEGRKQTTATLEDIGLQKQMGDKKYIRTWRYYLNISQFIDKSRMEEPLKPEGSLF